MKDLTDYFTTPTEKTNVISLKCSSPEIITTETQMSSENSAKEVTIVTDIRNPEKEKSKNVRNKKKKKKRKPSHSISTISEACSSSLNIVSANNDFEKAEEVVVPLETVTHKRKSKTKSKRNRNNVEISNIKLGVLEEDADNDSTCLRHKQPLIIKSESSQNDVQSQLEENENNVNLRKNNLNSRSKLNAFELMMESRNKSIGQNSPGKELQEDEKTSDNKAYKEKLSARTNLLQNWAERKGASKRKRFEEEKDEIINLKLKKRAKRLKKLLRVDESVNIRKVKVMESSSESSKDPVDISEVSTDILNSSVVDLVEENAQDRVMQCSKSNENKRDLPSFFGILNTSKNCNENKNEGKEKVNSIKTKTFNAKEKSVKPRLSLKNRKKESEIVIDENVSEQSTVIEESNKLDQTKNFKDSNKVFSKRKSEIIKTPQKKVEENDDGLTPQSLQSWKMKIKLSMEDAEKRKKNNQVNKRPVRTKRSVSRYHEFVTDESSNEGKIPSLRKKNLSKTEFEEIVLSEDEDFMENKRPKRQCTKPFKAYSNDIILSESEDDSRDMPKTKKAIKVAPVFLKATPKPKEAPEVLEARKQFLMSGVPSSLKRTMEKQQSMEEREYDIFPSISHVQQKCESVLWKLTKPELNLKAYLPLKIDQPDLCSGINASQISNKLDIQPDLKKVDKLKTLLNKIKADNPTYPVYKCFRVIHEKSDITQKKKNFKQKPKEKSADDSVEIIEPDVRTDSDLTEHAMWTEKYKPNCADDIIGNSGGIKTIKKWLQTWIQFCQENKTKMNRRNDSTSESEFDTTDCDSRDSTNLPGNTIVVGGPCGSGKSTAVYAICKELGCNVIELNASSKRTGKRLIQELQEATQSHQVRKNEKSMRNFLKAKTPKEKTESTERQREKRMCVLLIEDVDLVFEQDDGFISSLIQLTTTSKRPIIMTTTDPGSVFAQRFISQYDYVSLSQLSSQTLATWLQIVCLVEGLFVNRDDIGCLLEFNVGDVRKTLLELQFWVQSGGQLIKDDIPVKIDNKHTSIEEKFSDDETPLGLVKDENKNRKDCALVHSNCIGSFEIFRGHKTYSVPYYLNLGLLWWNMPNILSIPNFSSPRLSRLSDKIINTDVKEIKKHEPTPVDKIKLNSIEKLYDSLALTDIMFRRVNYFSGTEPDVKNFSSDIKDSLELGERTDTYDGYLDFVHDATHTLVNGCIEQYNAIEGGQCKLDMAVPGRAEKRWRAKHHVCEDVFEGVLLFSSYVQRKSIALDYMPSLRNISRSESRRAENNTKRKNRFRNYLRDLNINYSDSTLKLACNILTMDNEL